MRVRISDKEVVEKVMVSAKANNRSVPREVTTALDRYYQGITLGTNKPKVVHTHKVTALK